MWRLTDLLREYRGDSHTAAWISSGFKAPEIGLLSELFWGIPLRTYVRSRAWSSAQLNVAEAHLREHGLIDDGGFTDFGRTVRENIEVATDRQCTVMVRMLGDDFDELITQLRTWGGAIRAAAGYPAPGPQDLAPRVAAPHASPPGQSARGCDATVHGDDRSRDVGPRS